MPGFARDPGLAREGDKKKICPLARSRIFAVRKMARYEEGHYKANVGSELAIDAVELSTQMQPI